MKLAGHPIAAIATTLSMLTASPAVDAQTKLTHDQVASICRAGPDAQKALGYTAECDARSSTAPVATWVDDNRHIVAGGVGVLGVLGLTGVGIIGLRRRKNQKAIASEGTQAESLREEGSSGGAEGMSAGGADRGIDTGMPLWPVTNLGEGSIGSAEVDPVEEAQVYVAYGREVQAIEVLEEALEKDLLPSKKIEVALKLMEIYANQNNHRKLDAVYDILKGLAPKDEDIAKANAILEDYKTYGPTMKPAADPTLSGDPLPTSGAASRTPIVEASDLTVLTEIVDPDPNTLRGLPAIQLQSFQGVKSKLTEIGVLQNSIVEILPDQENPHIFLIIGGEGDEGTAINIYEDGRVELFLDSDANQGLLLGGTTLLTIEQALGALEERKASILK